MGSSPNWDVDKSGTLANLHQVFLETVVRENVNVAGFFHNAYIACSVPQIPLQRYLPSPVIFVKG